MAKIHLKQILVLCFLNFETTRNIATTPTALTTPIETQTLFSSPTTTELKTCPEERSYSYPITWPKTIDITPSQPPCVNQVKEILYRQCIDGVWDTEPRCNEVQTEKSPLCPDGFVQEEKICFMVTPKTVFPPNCPFTNVLAFFTYIDTVEDKLEDPIWVPVVRDLSNGLDFFRWTEASDFYKTTVTEYTYIDTISGKNCLIYDINLKSMVAVSCNEEHLAVCAYDLLNLTENKFCGDCRQSDYSSKTTCFCEEKGEQSFPRAEFIKPYQNSIRLTSDVCNFGLQKSPNGTYYWTTSNQEIAYTFWSPEAIFDNDYVYGAVTPNGWILTKNLSTCFITEQKVLEENVTLTLNFDTTNNVFVLTVTNPDWLQNFLYGNGVMCFSDAYHNDLFAPCEFEQIVTDVPGVYEYTFKPVEPFAGYYWCEAFKFSNLELVQTEKFFFQTTEYFEFVAKLEVTVQSFSYDLLDPHIMEVLNETVLSKLNVETQKGTSYIPRIMKIVDLNEESNLLYLNVHFSSTLEITATTNSSQMEAEFNNLKSIISILLYNYQNIKLVDFSSSNFCGRKIVYYTPDLYLTWPTTLPFTETTPEEFCFRSDGNLVTNVCFGDFTEGYGWIKPYVECTFLQQSTFTPALLSLFHPISIPTDDIKRLVDMDVASFISSDIYLYAEICYKYFISADFDFDVFPQAVENIFKMNRRWLLQAQLVTYATNKMLRVIENVLTVWQDSIQIVNNNFIFFSSPSDNVGGIAVQLIDGVRNLTVLEGDWNVEMMSATAGLENLEFAIMLGPEIKTKIDDLSKLAFSFFFNDALFGEQEFPNKNITVVFEVLFLNDTQSMINGAQQLLPGPVTIVQKMTLSENIDVSCVAWMYATIAKGFWIEMGESYNLTSYQICSFWNSAHLALATSWKDENVTADLEGLLGGDYFDPERINQLLNISKKYDQFELIDVLLVGKVLDLVKNNTDNDLKMLAKIVNNVHRIDRLVLAQSQEEHSATDLILYNIDNIIKNYNTNESEVLITTDNFILFVSNLKTNNVSGLLLLKSNQAVEVRIVRDNFTISNITSYHNFSSGVLLSSNLKKQWDNDSKIIITIFFKDVLFNEEQSEPNDNDIRTIFGVVLPENVNYTDPITVVHNITNTTKYSMECVHWNYSTDSENKSYWKKDSDANSDFISQCDFWHTTHFALILTNRGQDINYDILDWIATINSALSVFGLLGIVLTAILFQKWRRNIGNRILLNFSGSIMIQIVTFYLASTVNRHSDSTYCTLIGVLLHYSIISQFCWMLTIAILQFKRFVQVFVSSPKYLLLKTCVCGWVFPLLPVMLALVLDNEKYVMGDIGLCYPSGLGLYLGIWAPIAIIGTINLIIFVYIVYSIFSSNDFRSGRNDGKHQWRLFVLLFFMLGVTWIFGFLTGFSFGIVFACMFCFTATLQGFVLFLYFIVFNVNTRYLYARAVKNLFSKECNK